MARALGDAELVVNVAPHLDGVKAMVEHMAAETHGEPHPAALDREGVTSEGGRRRWKNW